MLKTFTKFQTFLSLTSIVLLSWNNTLAAEQKDLPARSFEEEIKDGSGTLQTKLNGQIPDAILNISSNPYFSDQVFVVDKMERSLTIWQLFSDGIRPIRHYPTDMGKNQGDKKSLGDHKTPEGIYTFMEKYEGNSLDFSLYGSRAFTLNYPNLFDNLAGKTGSGIWLHAVPDKVPLTRGSRGCVVVRDQVIKELSQFVDLRRTPIIIRDAVQYVPAESQKKKFQDILAKIEDWRKAWESKDVDRYIAYYGDSFKALGMNKNQWRRYKTELNSKYQSIKVKFAEPSIFEQKDQIVVKTLQAYESERHSDFGEKTIYLNYNGDSISIVGEEWNEIKDPSTLSSFNSSLFSLKN